jgi:DNA-binding transcriptional regulator YiaG
VLEELLRLREMLRQQRQNPDIYEGSDIKDIRSRLGMTQEKFAEELEISLPTIRSWEQDQRQPGIVSQLLIKALMAEHKLKNKYPH